MQKGRKDYAVFKDHIYTALGLHIYNQDDYDFNFTLYIYWVNLDLPAIYL